MNLRCDVALSAPSCVAAASCNSFCSDAALFASSCTDPAVLVTVSGNATADYESLIEANLPVLSRASVQVNFALTALNDLSSNGNGIATKLQGLGSECSTQYQALAAELSSSMTSTTNLVAASNAGTSIRAKVLGLQ